MSVEGSGLEVPLFEPGIGLVSVICPSSRLIAYPTLLTLQLLRGWVLVLTSLLAFIFFFLFWDIGLFRGACVLFLIVLVFTVTFSGESLESATCSLSFGKGHYSVFEQYIHIVPGAF